MDDRLARPSFFGGERRRGVYLHSIVPLISPIVIAVGAQAIRAVPFDITSGAVVIRSVHRLENYDSLCHWRAILEENLADDRLGLVASTTEKKCEQNAE
jgi:hypothetical protein